MHRVVALALDRVVAFDLATPAHVFGHACGSRYAFGVCAPSPGELAATGGLTVSVADGLEALGRADTVIVPGYDHRVTPVPEALEALRAAHARGARVTSICTGAFALAWAGLLDGRRATTHWDSTTLLASMFPAVEVDPDVLYVDEGDVLTSAGVAAGIDLCLHLVRRDHGAEGAGKGARRIVVAPHRDGGQAQFVDRPLPDATDASLASTRAWAVEHLDRPLDVATLARHAAVSERTFARRFRAETGTTPLQWLLRQRVLETQRLLEGTDLPVEDVAARCGFGTAASLREHFRRANGTSPTR